MIGAPETSGNQIFLIPRPARPSLMQSIRNNGIYPYYISVVQPEGNDSLFANAQFGLSKLSLKSCARWLRRCGWDGSFQALVFLPLSLFYFPRAPFIRESESSRFLILWCRQALECQLLSALNYLFQVRVRGWEYRIRGFDLLLIQSHRLRLLLCRKESLSANRIEKTRFIIVITNRLMKL